MTIFLFGSGVLGRYLFDNLSPSNQVTLFPGRSHINVHHTLAKLSSNDFVIDLLDPASFLSLTPGTISQLLRTRELLVKQTVAKYIYLSSSSIYQSSCELLTEISPTIQTDSSCHSYPQHKLKCERLVSSLCASPYVIARPPNLWSAQLSENKGFFLDLFRSYSSGVQLAERQGDELVFSFMSYSQAALLLGSLLFSHLHGVVNLPSNTYSSRHALKTRQHPPNLPATGRILSTLREFDFDLDSETVEDSWVYW